MEINQALIVDDSSTARMIAQRCIAMSGRQFDSFAFAENGLEAIAYLRQNPLVSVIVTDMNMPKMDGQALVEFLKSDPALGTIPIIVISSVVEGDTLTGLESLGVSAIVKKPLTPAKMFEALGGVL